MSKYAGINNRVHPTPIHTNIRERLKAMVNGTLEIESAIGVGTKVLITIPKEV